MTSQIRPAQTGAPPQPYTPQDSPPGNWTDTKPLPTLQPDISSALDDILNLNGTANLTATLEKLSAQGREDVLQALATLLKHGVVGYEYREINGQPQKVFIDVAMGSDLHRAPLVRDGRLNTLI